MTTTTKTTTTNTTAHNLKTGDILMSMWGWEQTNIDYFQVVKLIGKTMVGIRPIHGEMVEATGYMTGKVRPVKDSFKRDCTLGGDADTVYRRKVSKHGDYITVDSVRFASKTDPGKAHVFTSYY